MNNLTAQSALENPVLKTIDYREAIDIAYPADQLRLYIDLDSPLERLPNSFLKRIFDLALSSILLFFLFSWLLPIIALLIKLDSNGPVFFFQKRTKKDGKLFTCIKFRTMVVNKEADLLPAFENDQRITRLGKFLRRHHIDELPQLVNVWWGDMSIIGPRPYMVRDNERFETVVEHYLIRHKVKPGITGPAQLLGYGGRVSDQKMKHRADMDLHYVREWSLKLDIIILYKTFRKITGV
jgi:lipopolysaccharide/colanic/teichoic acid biosynthesis glycosyltransferase